MNTTRSQRQHWMSVMAKAPSEKLIELASSFIKSDDFKTIRAPEIGLAQIRGRMGGTGNTFNLGDTTITRCVVQSTAGHYGYAFIRGRDKAHAQCAAKLDALMQQSTLASAIDAQVIEPLQQQWNAQQKHKRSETDATKVKFFTLVRGED
ncbi:phosphonate C-P lyase system protein PhnG [Sedimenticola selenatireducens]|uniref:Phosphonate C-P lyase system protein PhnG n=1 Tax=Sedimenticola selenatireducens TaxID=191960 RepID=A0A558DVW7_9GAMM|nr:phosphonate C-P lyase system protein PhnG [Sedimenticola selenatireducens]TVO77862.1 phosphonate C-P lyase system protein PhnG [Sedimenticola selenatireducens]TVT65167.1 MAG: phosphonate C-P lyase system protein PhnG [Sedimenticola selenatireducens]